MPQKAIFFLLISLIGGSCLSAQNHNGVTNLYRRILIVENNQKRTTNDDAHFITFTAKGFYTSDANGMSVGEQLIPFVKNEKSFHCYSGFFNGQYSQVFFSSDYSRINVIQGNKTYVYQREPGITTTASMRPRPEISNRANSNFIPNQSSMPVLPTSSSGDTRPKRRMCTTCGGTGKYGEEIIYRNDYTGQQLNEYCSKCGRTTTPHYHREKMCRVCMGRGYIEN